MKSLVLLAMLSPQELPLLPQAVASFGAARTADHVYVYGGHVGRTHAHSKDNLTGAFGRFPVRATHEYEALPAGPPLQGLALVAHRGRLYRVGGMTARNAAAEPDDLWSTDGFACFDPARGAWRELAPLPEPRSSHDAFVVGDHLFVVGGWMLRGTTRSSEWPVTVWRADLSQDEPRWERAGDAPFERRALTLALWRGELVAAGGMTPDRKTSRAVDVYDPASGKWRSLPALPSDGFGAATAAWQGDLIASTRDGRVWRLAPGASEWRRATDLLLPRCFHRLVEGAGALLALGGADTSAHVRVVEPLAPGDGAVRVCWWQLPYPGAAKNRQGLIARAHDVVVFGGNRSLGQHDFKPEDFLDEAFAVPLGGGPVQALPHFPAKRQSMAVAGDFVTGGFGHDGTQARSRTESWRFDGKSWVAEAALPAPRTQLAVVQHGEARFAFGGLDYDPSREKAFELPLKVLRAAGNSGFEPTDIVLPRPRRSSAVALLGDRVYLVGGMRGEFTPVAECDVYDFAERAWSTMPPPARPRVGADLVALDGGLYLVGGSCAVEGGKLEPATSIERFDPAEQRWSTLVEKLPVALRHVQARAWRGRLLLWTTHLQQPNQALVLVVDPATGALARG